MTEYCSDCECEHGTAPECCMSSGAELVLGRAS